MREVPCVREGSRQGRCRARADLRELAERYVGLSGRRLRQAVALGLLAAAGCASERIVRVEVPTCRLGVGSEAYAKCAQTCPDGQAMIWENATEVYCLCRKQPDGT
jgi:hypothetical protein